MGRADRSRLPDAVAPDAPFRLHPSAARAVRRHRDGREQRLRQGAVRDAGEGGGAHPGVQNLVPSDIEIRRNHLFKPLAWKSSTWGANAKNLLELKQGRRVLIDGNVLENSWPAGQAGFAFVLWSVNQQGGCSWCVTEHVTIRNNIVRRVASAFQLTARWTGQPSGSMNHVTIRNNVLIGLNDPSVASATSRVFQIGSGIPELVINHNTGIGSNTFVWGPDAAPTVDQQFTDNVLGGEYYPIFSPFGEGSVAWARTAGPGR